jgi:hypothetical protein
MIRGSCGNATRCKEEGRRAAEPSLDLATQDLVSGDEVLVQYEECLVD